MCKPVKKIQFEEVNRSLTIQQIPWSDFDQPPKTTRRKGSVAVRTGGISEFFFVSASREIRKISVDMIVLITAHSLTNCVHRMVPPITSFMLLNE